MQALIIFALVIGITISTGPEQVPTSLCHDPLLGPSMIIYSDCGGVQEEPEKRKKEQVRKTVETAEQAVEQVNAQPQNSWHEQQPVEKLIEQPARARSPESGRATEGTTG
jgi:hypothetical protein